MIFFRRIAWIRDPLRCSYKFGLLFRQPEEGYISFFFHLFFAKKSIGQTTLQVCVFREISSS